MKKAKRILSLITSLCMTSACFMSANASVLSEEKLHESGIFYEKIDEDEDGTYDFVRVTGADDTTVSAEIPEEIDELPVTYIFDSSFYDADSLKNISVPETVTLIGYRGVFSEGVENIDVAENNSYYSSEDGVMFDKDKTVLLQYPPSKAETEYTVPENMDAIGAFAFAGNKNLKEITVSENVEVIGNEAFMNCSALESITIENPDCQINEFGVTISNGVLYGESYFNGVIYGRENSTAQAYAEEHGYNFAVIDTEPVKPIVTEVTTADTETTDITTTYSTSIICVLTTTQEKRACENCENLIYRSEGVITPLGMFLCTDCRALGIGGTLPAYPTEKETTQTTVAPVVTSITKIPEYDLALVDKFSEEEIIYSDENVVIFSDGTGERIWWGFYDINYTIAGIDKTITPEMLGLSDDYKLELITNLYKNCTNVRVNVETNEELEKLFEDSAKLYEEGVIENAYIERGYRYGCFMYGGPGYAEFTLKDENAAFDFNSIEGLEDFEVKQSENDPTKYTVSFFDAFEYIKLKEATDIIEANENIAEYYVSDCSCAACHYKGEKIYLIEESAEPSPSYVQTSVVTSVTTETSVSCVTTSTSIVQTECGYGTGICTSENLPLVTTVTETDDLGTESSDLAEEELEICMVVSVGEDEVLLNNDMVIYQKTFQEYSGENFNLKYGDVIGLANIHYLETAPMQPGLTEDSYIKYLGSAEEYYADSMKNLTVTEISDDFEEIVLIDSDGQRYTWVTRIGFMDRYGRQYNIDPRSVNIGDVFNCITEPIEIFYSECDAFPVSTVTESASSEVQPEEKLDILMVVCADEDRVLLNNYMVITQKTFQEYSGESFNLKCGDVIGLANVYYLESSPMQLGTDENSYIKYLGSAEEYYADSMKNLTVTEISNDFEEIVLTDSDGQSYTWYTRTGFVDMCNDRYNNIYPYPLNYAIEPYYVNIGDVFNCITEPIEIFYGNDSVFPISTVSTVEDVIGDANGDNEVTVRDCAVIASALATGKAKKLNSSADFNKDGEVNVRDAAAISKTLAKIK